MFRKSAFYYLLISLAVLLADQISKTFIVNNFQEGDTLPVLGNFLSLHFIYNQGGAMGTSIGPRWVYMVLTTVALIFIIRYFIKSRMEDTFTKISLALILGGAMGNLVDRFRFGKVVDFIDADIPDIPFLHLYRWFTFNIADAAITIGLVLFAISILFFKKDSIASNSLNNPDSTDNLPESKTSEAHDGISQT